MARITIKTRDNGNMNFWVPDEGGYVRLETGCNHGSLGRQICKGGGFMGSTVTATPKTLEFTVRRWYRAYRARIVSY
jgi:hypothetical protein